MTNDQNKTASGIGSKIVDALKKQDTDTSFQDDFLNESFNFNEVDNFSNEEFMDGVDFNTQDFDFEAELVTEKDTNEFVSNIEEEPFMPAEESSVEEIIPEAVITPEPIVNIAETPAFTDTFKELQKETLQEEISFEVPQINVPELTIPEAPKKVSFEPTPVINKVPEINITPQPTVVPTPAPVIEPVPIAKQEPVKEAQNAASYQNTSGIPEINIVITENVEMLAKLVSQLPVGVTRQTGAQIIRQTMEAMGVSMNKVLSEAQHAQEQCSQAVRDNMNTVEEFKNKIKILEKQIHNYRKQSSELDDLINLFILADKVQTNK